MEIREEDRELAEVKTENVFFSFISEDEDSFISEDEDRTLVTFSLPAMAELLRIKANFNKYQNETNRIIREKEIKFDKKQKNIVEAHKTAVSKKDRIGWRDAVKNQHRNVDQYKTEVQAIGVGLREKSEDLNRNISDLLRKNNEVVIGNYKLCKKEDSWSFRNIWIHHRSRI